MLLTLFALVSAQAPSVDIKSITWDPITDPRDANFISDLAAITLDEAVASDQAAQALAHFNRSDLVTGSRFHRADQCDVGPEQDVTNDALLGAAAQSRIVIVNEAHVSPWHRETTRTLLAPLKALGYTHFAAETFNNLPGDADPVADGVTLAHARRGDGNYLSEPLFGRLVREAKALDYRLAAYEIIFDANNLPTDRRSAVDQREQAQAEHLAAILRDDLNAKLVVHVGHSHVSEVPIDLGDGGPPILWMAGRLAEMTGINPVTISQTACTLEAGTMPRLATVPATLRQDIGTDFIVATSPPANFRVRPDDAMTVRVPPSWRSGPGWTLVEAIHAGEPDDAVAADHLIIHAGETDTKTLYLAPGAYRIRLRPVHPTAVVPQRMIIGG